MLAEKLLASVTLGHGLVCFLIFGVTNSQMCFQPFYNQTVNAARKLLYSNTDCHLSWLIFIKVNYFTCKI